MDHIAIFLVFFFYPSTMENCLTEFSAGFLSVQMFYGFWSALAAEPHLTLYSPELCFFFFNLKEEDYRIKNGEFPRTLNLPHIK